MARARIDRKAERVDLGNAAPAGQVIWVYHFDLAVTFSSRLPAARNGSPCVIRCSRWFELLRLQASCCARQNASPGCTYPFGNETTFCAEQVLALGRVFSQKDARLLAAGFVTDNMKCLDWAESEAPLYLLPNTHARQRPTFLAQERLVPAASMVALGLRGAMRDALAVDDGQKTRIATTFEQFWIDTC